MGLSDAEADPMSEVFDTGRPDWTYDAIVPAVLRSTALPLPAVTSASAGCIAAPHTSTYWARAMAGQDFSREDQLHTASFNLALWRGLKGDAPYPIARDKRDLRGDRARLLAANRTTCG
jgi:hypothetical protein